MASMSDYHVTPMGLHKHITHVDKRNMKRTVPMKVLGLGLGRTGTSSMRAALIQLGYVDTYHMITTMAENVEDAEIWRDYYTRKFEGGPPLTRKDFDAIMGDCMATVDWPAVAFPEELIAAYPDAKIVLTVRDSPEVWHKSAMDTIYAVHNIFGTGAPYLMQLMQRVTGMHQRRLLEKISEHHIITEKFPRNGAQEYIEHNELVRRLAPKDKILEFNVKQGWGPLCEFLEVPVPDTPFPRFNESQAFKDMVAGQRRLFLRNMVIAVSTVGVAVGAWLHATGRAPWL